jgi:aldehyde:ferredoxin oxidoreductase
MRDKPDQLYVLKVNLSDNTFSEEVFDEIRYREYLGGWNLILHYMLKEIPVGADPLGPENVLTFAAGVLTGIPVGGMARNSAGAKSPLTGMCALSEAGGFFGAELKRSGFDAVVLTGRADQPVFLAIVDGRAELHEAESIWGADLLQAEEEMRRIIDQPRARTALIGPAGEHQVPAACILNDLSHAYGRGGLGAVMGSKNLKGIIVKGSSNPPWHDRKALQELGKWFNSTWKDATPSSEFFAAHGTIGFVRALNDSGSLPTHNFRESRFAGSEKITGEVLTEQYLTGRGTCFACPVACKREVEMREPYVVDKHYGGPEYETAAAFGSNCGNADLAVIVKANEMCNAGGIDTISAGSAIAWIMNCGEAGLLPPDFPGREQIRFGNGEVILELLDDMIHVRSPLGRALGRGAAGASAELGFGADLAMHVKGQDLPYHEPRVKHGLGLSYAVSPTGADHVHAVHDTAYIGPTRRMEQLGIYQGYPPKELHADKIKLCYYEILVSTLYNSLVICNHVRLPYRFDITILLQAIRAAAGWEYTLAELLKVAERSLTMARCFNLREGLKPEDDTLPTHFFQQEFRNIDLEPLNEHDFLTSIQLFYDMMGWSEVGGVPTRGRLELLDLGWIDISPGE